MIHMLKESQESNIDCANEKTTEALINPRKCKPKWIAKEAPSFEVDPKKCAKQIKITKAIIDQTGYKNTMEPQEASTKEAEMDEEYCCILLKVALDGTACHAALACKERSECQGMIELK